MDELPIRITTIDDTPLPAYETAGAAAFDIQARKDTTIEPHSLGLIPTGLIIEVPEDYMLVLAPRSSTPRKKGLLIPHGIGILDQDYHGPQDEALLQFYNYTEQPVTITKGEKLGQGVFVRIAKADWKPTKQIKETSRGGFGSTDS